MLTKILFTALVIFAVYVFYQYRGRPRVKPKQTVASEPNRRFGHMTVYAVVVALLLVSGAVYFYQWRSDHRIVTIRVIDSTSSNVTVYQAYQKSIKGNRFESLDGRTVVLSEAERVEYITNE